MQNDILYSGKVKITVNNKATVKRSNSGTAKLFSILCNILAGNIISDTAEYIPIKFAMIHSNYGKITNDTLSKNLNFTDYSNVSLLTSELNITEKKINSESSSVCYATLLTHSQLKTSARAAAASSKVCYALLLNNCNEILAHAPFEYVEISTIWEDAYGQGAVEWEMFFANKEESR